MTVPFPTQMSRILNPARTTAMIRQEARMIRYNAHMMIQQSRLLDAQADMMDAEADYESHGFDERNMYGRREFEADNMSSITEHDSDVEVIPKVIKVSIFCGTEIHKFSIQVEPIMSPRPDMTSPYQSHEVQHLSDERKESKIEMNNIEKDIKNIIKRVVLSPEGLDSFDENIFASKIFQEADQLLTGNSRFNELILSVSEEMPLQPAEPKVRKIEKVQEPENGNEPVNLSTHSEDNEVERRIQNFKLVQFTEFSLTNDEVTWSDKMYQNIASTFKLLIRPDFHQSVMDLQLGNINQMQFKQV